MTEEKETKSTLELLIFFKEGNLYSNGTQIVNDEGKYIPMIELKPIDENQKTIGVLISPCHIPLDEKNPPSWGEMMKFILEKCSSDKIRQSILSMKWISALLDIKHTSMKK